MKGLKAVAKLILEAKQIVISGHVNPDGDSIGSMLALGIGLKMLGKEITMISPGGVPARYRGLPGASQILKKTSQTADLTIAVDCGGKELLSGAFGVFERAKYILEIDHHEFRSPFGDARIVEPKAASVGEMIYGLLRELKVNIGRDIAENILTTIIVETNSFRLPNIRPLTFEVCSRMLRTGVDFSRLSEMVYWSKPKRVSLLIGFCLSKCKFLDNDRIIWCVLKKKDLRKVKAKDEDADSIANEMLSVKGVAIALFFRETNKKYLRVSLRSKYGQNVARLAQDYGGGGHFDAAGCRIKNSTKSVARLIKDARDLLRSSK